VKRPKLNKKTKRPHRALLPKNKIKINYISFYKKSYLAGAAKEHINPPFQF